MVPIIEDGKVIANPSVAQELLPTQDGFFFGNTDYDAWYLDDVKETAEMLKLILEEGDSGSFYYQSSW